MSDCIAHKLSVGYYQQEPDDVMYSLFLHNYIVAIIDEQHASPPITQVCDEIVVFKLSAVSYVFLYADFGKITQQFWHVQFLHKWRIYVWRGLSLVVLLIIT